MHDIAGGMLRALGDAIGPLRDIAGGIKLRCGSLYSGADFYVWGVAAVAQILELPPPEHVFSVEIENGRRGFLLAHDMAIRSKHVFRDQVAMLEGGWAEEAEVILDVVRTQVEQMHDSGFTEEAIRSFAEEELISQLLVLMSDVQVKPFSWCFVHNRACPTWDFCQPCVRCLDIIVADVFCHSRSCPTLKKLT